MRTIIFCLLALVSLTGYAEPDRHLKRTARDIVRYSDEVAELWPGFWDEGQGFVLYDAAGEALVVAKDCVALGLNQFDDYKRYAFCEHQIEFGVSEAPFVNLVEFDDVVLPGARQSFYGERTNSIHNLFWKRAHQMMQSWDLEVPFDNTLELGDLTAEMITAIHIERELLSRGLSFTRKRESEQSLVRFLAARMERSKIMSSEQMRFQHQREWRDGVAAWLSGRALGIIEDVSAERIGVIFALNLKAPLNRTEELSYIFESTLYAYTGGSIIELMMRQGFPIYEATQAGFSPFDILSYVYDTSTMDTQELLADVVTEEYREDIMKQAVQAIEGQRDVTAIMQTLNEQGPYWVVFHSPYDRHVEYRRFYRSQLPDDSLVFRHGARTVLRTDAYSAELEGGWQHFIVQDPERETSVTRMPISELPDLSDCRGQDEVICPAGFELDGDDFTVSFKAATKLRLQADQLEFLPVSDSASKDTQLILTETYN